MVIMLTLSNGHIVVLYITQFILYTFQIFCNKTIKYVENKIGADTSLVECCYQQEFILHTLPMPQAYTRSYVFLFFNQNTVQPLITSTACHPNSPIPNTRKINLLARTNKNKHKMLLHFSYNLVKTTKSKRATSFVICLTNSKQN